jgi:hypothetical protein
MRSSATSGRPAARKTSATSKASNRFRFRVAACPSFVGLGPSSVLVPRPSSGT